MRLPIIQHVSGLEELDLDRPRTRADCKGGERPCPWVGCSMHLYLDVRPRSGSVQFNFPNLEPDQLKETCALDVADRGTETTLDEIGELMNVTRERIRQIEAKALRMIGRSRRLKEWVSGEDAGPSAFVAWVDHHRTSPNVRPPSWLFEA